MIFDFFLLIFDRSKRFQALRLTKVEKLVLKRAYDKLP